MLRVRQVLNQSDCRAKLRGKLPSGALIVPDTPRVSYPQSVLKLFDHESYSYLGLITEQLLRYEDIGLARLRDIIGHFTTHQLSSKVKLTAFLDKVKVTRTRLLQLAKDPLQYDTVVTGHGIEGHPDIRTETEVFEVKTSGRLKESWTYFLLQVFTYAALDNNITKVHLVLPLQAMIWSWDLKDWNKRLLFQQTLEICVNQVPHPDMNTKLILSAMFQTFPIGTHIHKKGSLVNTLGSVKSPVLPYQLFLGGPATTHVQIADQELAECQQLIDQQHLLVWVHAAYLINLCAINEYNVRCLTTLLNYAKSMGARGVVVHMGKHCQLSLGEAMNNMTCNLLEILETATPTCPLLLETPAGQGTEVLAEGPEALCEYCANFDDPRLGICVDTCHVFAAGQHPLAYLQPILNKPKWCQMLQLIHFNDSARPLGARVDRHEIRGLGHIGASELNQVAYMVSPLHIPLVCE
jgi:deoxyribonuclease IV